MDYKSLMGYNKKNEKVVEKTTKPEPKVNKVLESVKEEFGLVTEVGAAVEYRKKNTTRKRTSIGRSQSSRPKNKHKKKGHKKYRGQG